MSVQEKELEEELIQIDSWNIAVIVYACRLDIWSGFNVILHSTPSFRNLGCAEKEKIRGETTMEITKWITVLVTKDQDTNFDYQITTGSSRTGTTRRAR